MLWGSDIAHTSPDLLVQVILNVTLPVSFIAHSFPVPRLTHRDGIGELPPQCSGNVRRLADGLLEDVALLPGSSKPGNGRAILPSERKGGIRYGLPSRGDHSTGGLHPAADE